MDRPARVGDEVELCSPDGKRWRHRGVIAQVSGNLVRIGIHWYPAANVRPTRAQRARTATEDFMDRNRS